MLQPARRLRALGAGARRQAGRACAKGKQIVKENASRAASFFFLAQGRGQGDARRQAAQHGERRRVLRRDGLHRAAARPRHATVEAHTDVLLAEFEPRGARQDEPRRAAAAHARAGAQRRRPPRARQHAYRTLALNAHARQAASRCSRAGWARSSPSWSRGRGGEPFHAPALAELPDLDPQAIAALVQSLEARPAKLADLPDRRRHEALFAATDSLSLTGKF